MSALSRGDRGPCGVDQRVQSGLDVGLGSGLGMSGKRDALQERV